MLEIYFPAGRGRKARPFSEFRHPRIPETPHAVESDVEMGPRIDIAAWQWVGYAPRRDFHARIAGPSTSGIPIIRISAGNELTTDATKYNPSYHGARRRMPRRFARARLRRQKALCIRNPTNGGRCAVEMRTSNAISAPPPRFQAP